MRGRLLVFEGGEGAGKSTQLRRLAARFEAAKLPHLVTREPGGTPAGDRMRDILLHATEPLAPRAEALLMIASRAQLVHSVLRPALEAGTHVLLDRFFLSTYAYQVHGRGIPEEEIRGVNGFGTEGLLPDLTLLLRVPVAEGLARAGRRGAADRFEAAERAFHDRVAAAFDSFAEPAWQAAHPECGPIVSVDAAGSEDDVEARVLSALSSALPELLGSSANRVTPSAQPAVGRK